MTMKHKKKLTKLTTASTFSLTDWFYAVVSGASRKVSGTVMKTVLGVDTLEAFWTDMSEPQGFIDPETDVQISFVNGTRTFTIEPQATSFSYYTNATKYTKSAAETIVIPNTEGNHFIYYDGETLSQTTTFSDALIDTYAFVASIRWSTTDAEQIYIGSEFKHTANMDSRTHVYLHHTRGYVLESGGGLSSISADQDGSLDAHAQYGFEASNFHDEDAEFDFLAVASTATKYIYYKTGASGNPEWRLNDSGTTGVITTGTGRAAWNELTGGSWQLTEVTNNQFVLYHVFGFNDDTRKYGVIVGENEYATLPAARDGAETEIQTILLDEFIGPEVKFLGTVIYQTSDSYANSVKSRIRTTSGGFDYIDLRDLGLTKGGAGATVNDHANLLNLPWESGKHTGTASNLAGFDTLGNADNVALGTGLALSSSTLSPANNAYTEDTDPDNDADFLTGYDTSGTANSKIKPQNVCSYAGINAQTGTTYTLALTDSQKIVTLSNASAITLTVPPNSSVAFRVGTTITLIQIGAGQVTVAQGSGVTVSSEGGALKLNAQYAGATLVKTDTNQWYLMGSIST